MIGRIPAMPDAADRVRRFRHLHEAGCFVIPNPWDVGSTRVLAGLGFPALATTSSGFAWSQGRRDGQSSMEQTLGAASPPSLKRAAPTLRWR